MTYPRVLLSTEQLAAKNASCDTCYFVRRPYFHDYNTWMCEAPENMSATINPVTGRFFPLYKHCSDIREQGATCAWRKAQFIVMDDGTYKHIDQLPKVFEATGKISSPALARLRNLTADDF